jgi:hypothetical protein
MHYANTPRLLPNFVQKLESFIAKCWTTPGTVSCRLHQLSDDSYEIIYYPAIIEFVGGPQDGAKDFGGFHFNICKFNKVFDKPGAKISLNCMYKNITEHLIFLGNIDGHKVRLAILVAPPEGEKPLEKIYFSKVERN